MPTTIAETHAVIVDEITRLREELALATDPTERARIAGALDEAGIFLTALEAFFS